MTSYWHRNLSLLTGRRSALYERLLGSEAQFRNSVQLNALESRFSLGSTTIVDPVEVDRLIEGSQDAGWIIQLGIGTGRLCLELIRRTHVPITVIEQDARVVRAALELTDFSEALNSPRCQFWVSESLSDLYLSARLFLSVPENLRFARRVKILEHPSALTLAPEYYHSARQTLLHTLDLELERYNGSRVEEAFDHWSNGTRNLAFALDSYGPEIEGREQGRAAVILGPEEREFKAEPQRRGAVVISCGAHPSAHIHVLPEPLERIERDSAILLAPASYPASLLRQYAHRMILDRDSEFFAYLTASMPRLMMGSSRLTMAIGVALYLGCDPIRIRLPQPTGVGATPEETDERRTLELLLGTTGARFEWGSDLSFETMPSREPPFAPWHQSPRPRGPVIAKLNRLIELFETVRTGLKPVALISAETLFSFRSQLERSLPTDGRIVFWLLNRWLEPIQNQLLEADTTDEKRTLERRWLTEAVTFSEKALNVLEDTKRELEQPD